MQYGQIPPLRPGFNTVRTYLLLGVAYLFLATLFTFPLVFHAADHTAIADTSGDQLQTIWTFWWMENALFTQGQNPYWTNAIYYPYGTGLGYDLNPFTGLCAIAISTIAGLPINSFLIFNILLAVSFVITGWSAFTLIRAKTGEPIVAFLSSIFIVVSPYRLWHLNHLNLLATGWMILTIHFALRFLEHPKLRHLVYALVFFGITFYSSLTAASHTGIFLLAYACVSASDLFKHPERKRILVGAVAGIVLALLIAWPGLVALDQTDSAWQPTWQDSEQYSANLLGYLIPPATPSLVGQRSDLSNGSPSAWGGEVFLGWLLLSLLILTIILAGRRVSYRWLILAGVFLLISVGPTLQIGSYRILPGIWPQRWLSELVPYLGISRAPIRYGMLAQLCLVVFISIGLKIIIEKIRRHRSSLLGNFKFLIVSTTLIVGILFVEYGSRRRELLPRYVPEYYYQLAADPEIQTVYENPITSCQRRNYFMYWQTIHGKNVANGHITHHSRSAHTLLDKIWSWTDPGPDEYRILVEAGIDVIVHHNEDSTISLVQIR